MNKKSNDNPLSREEVLRYEEEIRASFKIDPAKEGQRDTSQMSPEEAFAYSNVREEFFPSSKRKTKVFMGLSVGLIVLLLPWVIVLRSCADERATNQRAAEARRQAEEAAAKTLAGQNPYSIQRVCEESVKSKLKAPSTAEFTETNMPSFRDGAWQWADTVDAQNSFGAKIRSGFTCTVTGTTPDDAKVSSTLLE